MSLEHWMMFSTFAEQKFFVYPKNDSYAGAIINANMASFAPSGLASFIMGRLHTSTKYIIDPMTHAFQHDPRFIAIRKGVKKGEPKPSIDGLARIYGPPISDIAGKEQLQPSHINANNIQDYVGRVLDFQRSHLCQYMRISEAAKYLDEKEIKKPSALIAPYFFMTEMNYEAWLDVNIRCLDKSLELKSKDERVYAEIVIDQGVLLDGDITREVLQGYKRLEGRFDGCVIWVDNFDEQLASLAELRALKRFCTELRSIVPEVINFHGGYYSILLGSEVGNQCLTGVAHAPEFGEYRSVVPVGGGIPIARYYVPRLHVRVRYREAADLFDGAGWLDSASIFHQNVCDCDACKETVNGDAANFTLFGEGVVRDVRRGSGMGMARIEFPSSETKMRCLKHYLQRKHREFVMSQSLPSVQVIEEMHDSIKMHQPFIGDSGVGHLRRWCKVLS